MQAALPAPEVQNILVTPTPFNTVLWRVLVMTDRGYYEGFYSLLNQQSDIRYQFYPQENMLKQRYATHPDVSRIAAFSHGFYGLEQRDNKLILTDLRMGLRENYAFTFQVAPSAVEAAVPVPRNYDMGSTVRWMQQQLVAAD